MPPGEPTLYGYVSDLPWRMKPIIENRRNYREMKDEEWNVYADARFGVGSGRSAAAENPRERRSPE